MGAELIHLPDDPSKLPAAKLVAACRQIYDNRVEIVDQATAEIAEAVLDAARKASAIERYMKKPEHKAEAIRAARILETAVGHALGPPPGHGPGRGKKGTARGGFISQQDHGRVWPLYQHRAIWWPKLDQTPLSQRKALSLIDEALRPKAQGDGTAEITHANAVDWLKKIGSADLLLTDPPYSTDIEDVAAFADSWVPLAFSRLQASARAFIFIGAYVDELSAYCSLNLPDGWQWGVPHAWCYRNTIGPTPEYDFIRNWQCILSAYGPEAQPLHSDRITELLAGFTENAPDGRHGTKYHRWQKPRETIDRLINLTTNPNNTIIDPFAGSGTTLIAAKELSRVGLGCDADREAVEICIARGCDAA